MHGKMSRSEITLKLKIATLERELLELRKVVHEGFNSTSQFSESMVKMVNQLCDEVEQLRDAKDKT